MLILPTNASELLAQVILPTLAFLPPGFDAKAAQIQLIAESAQETGLASRQQLQGPAHGLWQAEQGGSIRAVLANAELGPLARIVCDQRGVAANEAAVYAAVLTDDLLACAFARLDLYADSKPLPAIGDAAAAWDCYLRVERPGKPRPWDWAANYAEALAAVTGA